MLEKIKRRVGITDALQDDLIKDLIDDAQSQFKLITRTADEIDIKYNFILIDVVVKMYNRKGSEGLQSETVDGYSATYLRSVFDDHLPFLIKEFNLEDDNHREKGKVVFY